MDKSVKKQWIKAIKNATFFLGYACAFLLVWTIACSLIKNEYIFPPIRQVFVEVWNLLGERFFYRAFLHSVLRALWAFLIAFVLAVGFAVLAKVFPFAKKIIAPIVAGLRALPTMAIMLILLIWSTPSGAPIIVAVLALIPVLYTGVSVAISTVDESLEEMCRVYRVGLKKRIFFMYLPLSAPYIVREASAGASFALKLVVSAEVLAYTFVSLGGMLQSSKIYMQTPRTFALAFMVVLTGLLIESVGILLARFVEGKVQ